MLQGAATSVWAATAPELEQHSGAYLKNCQLSQPNKIAKNPKVAARLWQVGSAGLAAHYAGECDAAIEVLLAGSVPAKHAAEPAGDVCRPAAV